MNLNQRNRVYESVWIEEKGTKNDVNLIIISKVKKCNQSENDIIKEVLPGKQKIRKKSVWNRIIGGKGKSISESYRMQNNGLLNNEKRGS